MSYPHTTKILKGGTKRYSRFSLHGIFKQRRAVVRIVIEPRYDIQNQYNFMFPKRRFWKEEQKMKPAFSRYFSLVRSPNRVLTR